MTTDLKELGDLSTYALIVGISQDWLPAIAAVLAIGWTLVRMFEWFRFRVLGRKVDRYDL